MNKIDINMTYVIDYIITIIVIVDSILYYLIIACPFNIISFLGLEIAFQHKFILMQMEISDIFIQPYHWIIIGSCIKMLINFVISFDTQCDGITNIHDMELLIVVDILWTIYGFFIFKANNFDVVHGTIIIIHLISYVVIIVYYSHQEKIKHICSNILEKITEWIAMIKNNINFI